METNCEIEELNKKPGILIWWEKKHKKLRKNARKNTIDHKNTHNGADKFEEYPADGGRWKFNLGRIIY